MKWIHKSTLQSLLNQYLTRIFELLFSIKKREKQSQHFNLGILFCGSIWWDHLNYLTPKVKRKKGSFVLRFLRFTICSVLSGSENSIATGVKNNTRPFFQNLLQPTGSAAIQYWQFRLHTCIPIYICIHIYVYIEKALAHSRPRLFAHIIIFNTNAQTQPVPGKNVD